MVQLSVQEWTDRKRNLFSKHVRLGLANIGGLYHHKPPTLSDAMLLLDAAIKCGITRFDTAPLYGYRMSEQMFGRARLMPALAEALGHDRIDVSTKVLRSITLRHRSLDTTQPAFWKLDEPYNSAVEVWGVTNHDIGTQLFDSLASMNLPSVTGVALHDVYDAIHETKNSQHPISYDDMGPVVRFLKSQIELGRVREIGFADKFDEPIVELSSRFPKRTFGYCEATTFTLASHHEAIEKTLPLCLDHNMPYRVAGPFFSRILSRDPRKAKKVEGRNGQVAYYYDPDTRLDVVTWNYHNITDGEFERACVIWDLAQAYGEESPRAAAVQFCLAHPAVQELVIGASGPERLASLEEDINHPVPGAYFDALRDEGILHPEAPVPPVLASV
ncbi:MAG: aldo/keto reductase [Bdellovibrionota bacterium]